MKTARWSRIAAASGIVTSLLLLGACESGRPPADSSATAASPSPAALAEPTASPKPQASAGPSASQPEPTASEAPQAASPDSAAPTAAPTGARPEPSAQPSLPERLRLDLNREPPSADDFINRFLALAESYAPGNAQAKIVLADLDSDGQNEWIAALSEKETIEGIDVLRPYGIVVAYENRSYRVHGIAFPSDGHGGASVAAIGDLTGDEAPDIVWRIDNRGAHTTVSAFCVSFWANGRPEQAKGSFEIPGVSKVDLDGENLRATGGRINSVGAGPWQRDYTDTFVLEQGELKQIDREFAESLTPYHRLLDGLWAENFGRADRARRDYAAASDMPAISYEGYAFAFEGEWTEGGSAPEEEGKFENAVRGYARLRLALLSAASEGSSAEAACASAKRASGYDSSWLPYLNAPAGYANPRWTEETVCAPVDTFLRGSG